MMLLCYEVEVCRSKKRKKKKKEGKPGILAMLERLRHYYK